MYTNSVTRSMKSTNKGKTREEIKQEQKARAKNHRITKEQILKSRKKKNNRETGYSIMQDSM